jgi:hypothetical protein
MAITPGYKSGNDEGHYIDKGAVMTPQINPSSDAKYVAAKAQALAESKIVWPTKVAGISDPL